MLFANGLSGLMFNVMPGFMMIFFVLVFGIVIFGIVKGIGQWKYNNTQPVLDITAKVTGKRTNTSSSFHGGVGETGTHHSHSSTTYYVTFEVESGDRMEFMVNGREYGLLADNDSGMLRFQGTRFLGFTRSK
nr:DUF2500 domain-containing protein [Desulfosporosinus orientis]